MPKISDLDIVTSLTQASYAPVTIGSTTYRYSLKPLYDHSQATGNPHGTSISDISTLEGKITPLSDLNRAFAINGNGIPQFPDNAAGTYFKKISSWVNLDNIYASGCTASVEGGKIKVVVNTTGNFFFGFLVPAYDTALVVAIFTASPGKQFNMVGQGSTYTPIANQTTSGLPQIITGYTTVHNSQIEFNTSGWAVGDVVYINALYVGSGLYDTPVYGKDGQSTGVNTGVLPVNGKRGKGMKFLGANSIGIVMDSPFIGTTGKVKISFKRDAISEDHVFLSNAVSASAFYGWTIIAKSTNVLALWNGGSGAYQEVFIASIANTNDHTFCFDCDGSNIHYAFDGGVIQTVSVTVAPAQSTLPLTIGRNVTPSGATRGVVYDIRYDTGTLTQDEVIRYHNGDDSVDCQQKSATGAPNALAVFANDGFLGEHGTFTPELRFGGNNTGITYEFRAGFYNRIGKMIFFKLSFKLTSKGSATGDARIYGLPFNSSIQNSYTAFHSAFNSAVQYQGTLSIYNDPGASFMAMVSTSETGSVGGIGNAQFNNDSFMMIAGFYFID